MPTKRKTPVKKRTAKKSNLGSVKNEDKLSVGGAILSFLFPPVGVYHFFSNNESNPAKANTALGLSALGVLGVLALRYENNRDKG